MVYEESDDSPFHDTEHFTTPDLCQIINSKLYKCQSSGTMCDIVFSNGGISVWAHSCILAVVSPFMMRYMLTRRSSSGGLCHSNLVIPISVVTKMVTDSGDNCMDCLSDIIKYIYTSHIYIRKSHFHHIANISCNLEIDELISICQKYNDNTDSLLNSADFVNCNGSNSDMTSPSNQSNSFSKSIGLSSDSSSNTHDNADDSCLVSVTNKTLSISNKITDKNKDFNGVKDIHCIDGDTGNKALIACKEKPDNTPKISPLSVTKFNSNPDCEKHLISIQKCLDCEKIFDNALLLSHHRSVFHSNKFYCIYCSFKSNPLQDLIRHLLESKHGNKCSICLKELQNSISFTCHLTEDHKFPLPFPCLLCNAKFKTRHLWKRHLITHNHPSRDVFQCSLCNLIFNSKGKLKIHLLKTHTDKSKTCDICGYTSKYMSYLKRHLLKHDKKSILCNIPNCKFQTTRKSNLKEHLKTHNRIIKDFKCSICGVLFTLKKNLQRHMTIHDNPKVYECPECDYKNGRFDKVKHHCQMHSYSKDILDKLNEQYLSIHSKQNHHTASVDSFISESSGRENISVELSVSSPVNKFNAGVEASSNETDGVILNPSENTNVENSNRVVYLNEMTGELTFFCDSDGKPLKGVPDIITVHSIGGMNNNANFKVETNSISNSTGVILNEITGELNYIQLNFETTSTNSSSKLYSNNEVAVTVLDETTGEITSKSEQLPVENENIFDFDNIFDSIDLDAINDDSFDGFDDFDNALFDAEFSVGSASPDMDKILNEFTGELFTDESACRYQLDKQICNDSVHPLWKNVDKVHIKSIKNKSQAQEFAEIFLNEVTGELTAESSSLIH